MKIFKKTSPEPPRRQRLRSDRADTPTAFSYHARRADREANTGRKLQRSNLKPAAERLGRYWLQRFGLFILLIVALVCAVDVLTLSTDPKIELTSPSGDRSFLQTDETYHRAAAGLLAASIWNHNKITVDTGSVSQQLLTKFPELAAASVTLPLLAHRPVVYLQGAQPALILVTRSGSYVISTDGKALLPSDQSPALTALHLPVVTDQSALRVTLDKKALTPANVRFIRTVMAELAARHVATGSLTLPPGTSELDVALSGQPYFIKFNLANDDARQQAGTFLALQAKLRSQNITPAKYVDVRVDGRAYYL